MIKVHFLGIAGSGSSAVAAIAKANGFQVTGCDKNPTQEFTKQLKGIKIYKGHSPKHLCLNPGGCNLNVDILAVTPAIFSLDQSNTELLTAKEKG